MRKLKLKEDEEGNKTTEVNGIRAACKVMKTRYSKPFESVQVKIPYATGMSPYSGLFDLFEQRKLLSKEGNRYVYVLENGTEIKLFRKDFEKNEKGCLDAMMLDVMENPSKLSGVSIEEASVEE